MRLSTQVAVLAIAFVAFVAAQGAMGSPTEVRAHADRADQSCSPPPTVQPGAIGSSSVIYPAGWNLITGYGGVLSGTAGPLYTYDPASGSYTQASADGELDPARGYWAYFPCPASRNYCTCPPGAQRVSIPAGQWVMIGNPFFSDASLSGSDLVLYVYDPTTGYQQASVLPKGRGAWAFSAGGGTFDFTNPR